MDVLDTVDALFEGLLPRIIECYFDQDKLKAVLEHTRRAVLGIIACHSLDTTYILGTIQPKDYLTS